MMPNYAGLQGSKQSGNQAWGLGFQEKKYQREKSDYRNGFPQLSSCILTFQTASTAMARLAVYLPDNCGNILYQWSSATS